MECGAAAPLLRSPSTDQIRKPLHNNRSPLLIFLPFQLSTVDCRLLLPLTPAATQTPCPPTNANANETPSAPPHFHYSPPSDTHRSASTSAPIPPPPDASSRSPPHPQRSPRSTTQNASAE